MSWIWFTGIDVGIKLLPMKLKIRKAVKSDTKLIVKFIKKLATFEKLEHEAVLTPKTLEKTMFGKDKYAHGLIGEVDGVAVAYALYFFNFSTFLGRPGLYLEDLFVLPEYRSNGYGLQILKALAKIAKEKKCGRMEWVVLDWNTRAIDFYNSLGAELKPGWLINRLDEKNLFKLAK